MIPDRVASDVIPVITNETVDQEASPQLNYEQWVCMFRGFKCLKMASNYL